MASLRYLRSTVIGLSLLTLLSPHAVWADCPVGSGIGFPFLSPGELECQRTTFTATLAYFDSFLAARQDCFSKELNGVYKPGELDCLFPIANDQPGTTGDKDTDRRLRAAEAQLTRRILTHCTNVNLATIGFPGFCTDATPDTPYNAFDHNLCMLARSKKLGTFILDTEHPPFPGHLEPGQTSCQDELARLSSNMTSSEFSARGHCLAHQYARDIALPPDIDCRREVDPQDPQVNRPSTDLLVVEAHNHILRTVPNSCPAIDLGVLGFPHRCDFPDDNSVFPLPALTECLFAFHHHDLFRFLDLIFPCSTKCGNGVLNVEEECDDKDNVWMNGDFCRADCSRVACGDPNDDGVVNISDALYVLQASIGLLPCTLLVCDVTGNLKITLADALRLLQYAVGYPVLLNCPDLSVTCGNGYLEPKETCDDGDSQYNLGEYCNSACRLVQCGDTDDNGDVSIRDALFILEASVNLLPCDKEICDVTGNGQINSSDALRVLMWSVGYPVLFNCPKPPTAPPPPPIE